MIFPTTLRGRVVTAAVMLTTSLTVGGAFYSYVRVEHHLDKAMDRFIEHEVDEAIGELETGQIPFEPYTVRQLDGTIIATSADVPDGLPLLDEMAEIENKARGERRIANVHLDDSRFAYRVVQYRLWNHPDRIVQIATSREVVEKALRNYRENLFVAVPIGVVLTALIVWLLVWLSLRPLEGIIRTAEEVDVRDLTRRIPETGAGEVRRLSSVLNDMLTRIDEGVATIRNFSSDAAHELRTPLAVLRGELELLLDRVEEPEAAAALSRALDEAIELTHLTDALLLMTRGSEALAEEFGPIDLSSIAHDVATDAGIVAEARGLALSVQIDDGVQGHGHARLLRRVIWNLIDNALKFTDAGTVTLELKAEGGGATIRVQDTGGGIDPADLPRVFERFFRSRDVQGRKKGTGLGLPLVRWICEAHGGKIEAASTRGEGSSFVVTLPMSMPKVSISSAG